MHDTGASEDSAPRCKKPRGDRIAITAKENKPDEAQSAGGLAPSTLRRSRKI